MLATLQPGASYHVATLEDPRYEALFERRIRPESLDAASLDGVKVMLVPCRTNPLRLAGRWPVMRDFLGRGGVLVAMGETFQNEWIPGVSFHPEEANYWWWLEKGADLGVRLAVADHPLLNGLGKADVTWHLHGWYDLPPDARPLIVDREDRALMYEDRASFGGQLIVTSLDPCYHHGSHFMPATTRFLDGFLPNLAGLALGR